MGIWDKIKGEFIDIVEWVDQTRDTITYKFERAGNEIKNGAKLVVREGQTAVFVNEGQIADVYTPGTHTLTTENMPILSTLKGWKYGFNSPFKAEVFFVATRQFTDWKWGTKNPIMLRDPEIGPVRIRAFGSYALKVNDAAKFLREIVGTDPDITAEDIAGQLRNLVITRFTDIIGECKIPVLDMAANYNEFSNYIKEKITHDFDEYGLAVTKVLIENISLPPEVEAMLDKRSSMGILGDLNKFTQFQTANAIENAANNPGSGMGQTIGIGAGFAIGNQMAGGFAGGGGGMQPPPPPPQLTYFVAINGQQTGPFTPAQLTQMAQQGQFTLQSVVWTQGMAGWLPASQVQQLASVFGAVPPPPPPPPM